MAFDVVLDLVGGEQIVRTRCIARREPVRGVVLADRGFVRLILADKRKPAARARQSALSVFREQRERSLEAATRFLLQN